MWKLGSTCRTNHPEGYEVVRTTQLKSEYCFKNEEISPKPDHLSFGRSLVRQIVPLGVRHPRHKGGSPNPFPLDPLKHELNAKQKANNNPTKALILDLKMSDHNVPPFVYHATEFIKMDYLFYDCWDRLGL